MSRIPTLALVALLVAVAVGGCGLSDPYAETTREAEAPPSRAGARSEAAPREVVPGTPRATLRYAASLAGNWSRESAAEVFARLAALSVGAARAEFARIATQSRIDVQPVLGYAKSEATVEVVAVRGRGRTRRAIVVTRQRIATPQLAHLPAEYAVTLATLRRYGKGWAIVSWRPQP